MVDYENDLVVSHRLICASLVISVAFIYTTSYNSVSVKDRKTSIDRTIKSRSPFDTCISAQNLKLSLPKYDHTDGLR